MKVTYSIPGESATYKCDVPFGMDGECIRVHPEGQYDKHGVPVFYVIPTTVWESLLKIVWGEADALNIELVED